MVKGGYKVIDLSDIALSSVPYEIPGIYAKIQKSFEKAILISNLNIDGEQQQDYFCQPVKTAGGDFTMTVGDYTLTITSSDNVSVAEGIIGGGGSGETYTAGDNIQIQNGVISATDTKYTAGDNVQISEENVISATNTQYTAGTNVQISEENVISATDTTYSAMTGATASTAGTSGLVPAPAAGDEDKALCGDGTYHAMSSGGGKVFKINVEVNTSDYYMSMKPPMGGEIVKSFNSSQQTITYSGDRTDYDCAVVTVKIRNNSGIKFSGSGTLTPLDSSGSSFLLTCPMMTYGAQTSGTQQIYFCTAVLVWQSSSSKFWLSNNQMRFIAVSTAGNNDSSLTVNASVANDIIYQIDNNGGPAIHDVSGATIATPAYDVPYDGTGRFLTGMTISGTDGSSNTFTITNKGATVVMSRTNNGNETITIEGLGLCSATINGDVYDSMCSFILTITKNAANVITSAFLYLDSSLIK